MSMMTERTEYAKTVECVPCGTWHTAPPCADKSPDWETPEQRRQRLNDLADLRTQLGKGVPADDPVHHPAHYTGHPAGVECIQIAEWFNYNRGNALKYIWRAGQKGDATDEIIDLEKARWYVEREIARLTNIRDLP
jgi:Protein of unknwon function (DUF3310)